MKCSGYFALPPGAKLGPIVDYFRDLVYDEPEWHRVTTEGELGLTLEVSSESTILNVPSLARITLRFVEETPDKLASLEYQVGVDGDLDCEHAATVVSRAFGIPMMNLNAGLSKSGAEFAEMMGGGVVSLPGVPELQIMSSAQLEALRRHIPELREMPESEQAVYFEISEDNGLGLSPRGESEGSLQVIEKGEELPGIPVQDLATGGLAYGQRAGLEAPPDIVVPSTEITATTEHFPTPFSWVGRSAEQVCAVAPNPLGCMVERQARVSKDLSAVAVSLLLLGGAGFAFWLGLRLLGRG